jgi:hypothetical protein
VLLAEYHEMVNARAAHRANQPRQNGSATGDPSEIATLIQTSSRRASRTMTNGQHHKRVHGGNLQRAVSSEVKRTRGRRLLERHLIAEPFVSVAEVAR